MPAALAQLVDHVQDLVPREDALALQQLHQRRVLPHVGDGQLFEGDEVVGGELFSHYFST